ncbi:unnamed protein product [Didymodactylos carnosus]|uniref:Uncharacterized protein n=1 Tax=Didymodactylos carnosus TaxID=1234261 RepID=A0A814Z5E7_9BILA|nr:unnamed protein product [Didymodactylos carnosus]CAF1239093.1 unnamed protein product [Didymodactylos carnosus]CAF4001262.1 unnamed protein product [Didymodactylos carnosus]CAF4033895.1 unnamed protein product [Didymodactylos carnosus]
MINATRGNNVNETRQIQTDLIQKIVGVINTLIKAINLELHLFGLSLNKPLKSTFHTCAIVLLTKYYYNEQQNHFLQTLSTLSDRRNDLRSYFISMVVPNTSTDVDSGLSLCKQVKEYILKSLLEEGQRKINFELQQYDCSNRKWIQDRCDGKLVTADKQWFMDYIENPTKIIEHFFNDMWNDIQKSINQSLVQLKANHNDALEHFFHCIQDLNQQKQREEVNLILSCLHVSAEKLHLSDLVQAGELMYIGKKRDEILSTIVGDYRRKKNFPAFIEDYLIPVMYLLKRHQNLDDFMEALSFKLSQVFSVTLPTIPKISLRMLIHILSLKSDLSSGPMIMTLLAKRNPVP